MTEEWLCNNLHSASEEDFIKAMVDIAEPREKQIQIDAKQIRALQKQNGELTDKVKELEAQIEKMKSCVNCRYCINEDCPWQPKGCGMKHWELRR